MFCRQISENFAWLNPKRVRDSQGRQPSDPVRRFNFVWGSSSDAALSDIREEQQPCLPICRIMTPGRCRCRHRSTASCQVRRKGTFDHAAGLSGSCIRHGSAAEVLLCLRQCVAVIIVASQKSYWDIKRNFRDTILFYKIGRRQFTFGVCEICGICLVLALSSFKGC